METFLALLKLFFIHDVVMIALAVGVLVGVIIYIVSWKQWKQWDREEHREYMQQFLR